MQDSTMTGDAILSDDRVYRYMLERTWDCRKERVLFVMLNPSTADEEEDDPTITRCLGFATRWGFGSLVVGNLFALRSPNPRELFQHSDPLGPDNDYHLQRLAEECKTIVTSWGSSAKVFPPFGERQTFVKTSCKAGCSA